MAEIQQQYSYSIDLNYISAGKAKQMRSESISSMIIDYDYDNKNFPIIYITLNIDKSMMDDMLVNDKVNYVTVKISKTLINSPSKIPQDYINDRFFYFITTDPNYTRDIEYEDSNENKPINTDQYRKVVLGLIKVDHVNINKRSLAGTWMNSSLINIICYYTYQMPMLIEPVNNTIFNNMTVPPCTSVMAAFDYLNRLHCFYDTPYRYFVDFNRTYLVSSSGKCTLAKGETIESIILRAAETGSAGEKLGKNEGQTFNSDNKSLTINVEATQTSIFRDRVTDKSFNAVAGMTSGGQLIEAPLNMNNSDLSSKKIKLERVYNENVKWVNQLKKSIEGHAVIIQLNKTEVDSSLFNINKSYSVKNFMTYNDLDGPYLLARKQEIYLPDGDSFIMNTSVTLRKIMS